MNKAFGRVSIVPWLYYQVNGKLELNYRFFCDFNSSQPKLIRLYQDALSIMLTHCKACEGCQWRHTKEHNSCEWKANSYSKNGQRETVELFEKFNFFSFQMNLKSKVSNLPNSSWSNLILAKKIENSKTEMYEFWFRTSVTASIYSPLLDQKFWSINGGSHRKASPKEPGKQWTAFECKLIQFLYCSFCAEFLWESEQF